MTLESTTVETTTPATPASGESTSPAPATAGADQPKPDSEGLSAGFKKVRGGDAHTESRPDKPVVEAAQPEPGTATAAPDKDAGVVEKKPTVLASLTEEDKTNLIAKAARVDELEATLKSFTNRVNGTFGQLQQTLKTLQNAPAGGQPVKVAKDALKKLREAGFDEIADLLGEDLNGLILAAPANFDAAGLEKALSEKFETRVTEATKAYEKKILTIQHRDWPEIYASAEFKEWGKSLPEGVFTSLKNSWDSEVIGDALTDFKAWRDDRKKAADAKATQASATKNANDKRLEKAVAPSKGAVDNTPSRLPDAAGLSVGFKKVRGSG